MANKTRRNKTKKGGANCGKDPMMGGSRKKSYKNKNGGGSYGKDHMMGGMNGMNGKPYHTMPDGSMMPGETHSGPTMGGNRKKSYKNKNGGGSCGKDPMMGGKRKTRKASKGPSDWNKKVMEIYHTMKKSNPATKLGDAMKHASALKKKGQL